MSEYTTAVAAMRAPLELMPEACDFVRYATLAANSHNTQPWRFRLTDRSIEMRPDLQRLLPAVDPDNHHLFVSLGCAAENVVIVTRSF